MTKVVITEASVILNELLEDNARLIDEVSQLKKMLIRMEEVTDKSRQIGYDIIKQRDALKAQNEKLKNALLERSIK